MAKEIVVEIKDKVDNSVVGKIKQLAENSKIAHNSIERLKRTLEGIEPSTAKLARATAQLNNSQARQTTAKAKLKAALDKTTLANQRLATETQRTAAAQKRAELATLRLSTAQERANRTVKSGTSSYSSFRSALLGITASMLPLIGGLKKADEFLNLENRLRSTGVEGEELSNTMQKLASSANNARSDLGATVELYSRLAVSAKELGTNQGELINFTETLNKAVILGGASAQEAAGGIRQLSQGMASGVLRGEELTSVLENMPIVADIIAKSMGVTRGRLREMGAEGKITAQEILKAFRDVGPEIGEKFEAQVSTAGQAMTVLGNAIKVTLGGELKSTVEAISGATLFLAKNIEEVVRVVKALAIPLGAIVAMNLIGYLKSTQLAMVLMSTATAGGATGMLALKNAMLLTISATGGLVAVLGVAYYAYQKINEAANQRQKDEETLAKRRATQAADDVVASLKLERARLKEQDRLTEGWQGERYKLERARRASQIKILNEEILRAEKQANATRAHEAGKSTEEWLKMLEEAQRKASGLRLPATSLPPTGDPGGSAFEEVRAKVTITSTPWKIADSYSLIQKELAGIEAQQQKNLGLSSKELEINAKLADYAERMKETKGSELDIAIMRERVELLQEQADAIQRQAQILDQIQAKNAFGQSLNDVGNLIDSKKLTKEQGSDYLVGANPELFKGTQNELDANTRKYETMYAQLEELRDKDFISEEDYSKARTNLWLKQNETLLDQTEGTFANLAKLQQSSNKKMAAIGKVAANFQVAMNGIRAISEAWASGPWPYNAPAVAMATSAFAIQEAQLNELAGFKTGGYTGNAGISDVAGVVHGKEFVFDASSVQRIGVDNLERLRSGKTGSQGGSGAMGNTYVYQYNDYVQGGTEAEREGRFTQFKRAMQSAETDRSSARAQVTL